MNSIEQEFTNVVREHKGTIYTVCYMFSKDEDEVADLFQEILINIWNGDNPMGSMDGIRSNQNIW